MGVGCREKTAASAPLAGEAPPGGCLKTTVYVLLQARGLPGSVKKPFPRRLRTRCFSGLPEDDRFRFAAGETSPGAAKPAVPAQLRVGAAPGDPRKRPFSRCCGRDAPQLLRKRPKVCALIQQGAADSCFVALAVHITPGRWPACFWGYSGTRVITHTFGVFGRQGHQRSAEKFCSSQYPQNFAVHDRHIAPFSRRGFSPLQLLYPLAGSACASSSTNCATRRLGLSAA